MNPLFFRFFTNVLKFGSFDSSWNVIFMFAELYPLSVVYISFMFFLCITARFIRSEMPN